MFIRLDDPLSTTGLTKQEMWDGLETQHDYNNVLRNITGQKTQKLDKETTLSGNRLVDLCTGRKIKYLVVALRSLVRCRPRHRISRTSSWFYSVTKGNCCGITLIQSTTASCVVLLKSFEIIISFIVSLSLKQTTQGRQIKQEIRNTAVSDATASCITNGTKVPTIQFSILNLRASYLKHED
jgi:hypothetical protein